jgi:chitosanase
MVIIDTNDNVSGHLSVLKSLGVTAVGRYYASSQRKRLTRIEASAISAAGMDLFVVFENSGDPDLSLERGVNDAQIALAQARALGQPEGTAIYFALEHDKFGGFTTAHVPGLRRYLEGVRQVIAPTYKVGVYGDGVVCKTGLDSGVCEFTWLSASTKHPGTPEFTASGRATLIQGKRTPDDRGGAIDKNIDGLSTDFNIALKPDFGQFKLAADKPAVAHAAETAQRAAPEPFSRGAGLDKSYDAGLSGALADLKAAAQQLTDSIARISQLMESGALTARTERALPDGAPLASDATKPAVTPTAPIGTMTEIAANSKIAAYNWRNRGRAPLGYIKGMAVTYAESYCRLKANDPIAAAIAVPIDPKNRNDALVWYMAKLQAAGIGDNDTPGKRLRRLFVLLTGLGMRESSGRYCEGRDRSADNTSADTAEAGLFQVSLDLIGTDPNLNAIFQRYQHNPDGHLDIFKEGVTCKVSDLQNAGSPGERGFQFQDLIKKCPAFAVELAALGLRHRKSHWGPILRRDAEVLPSCEELFIEIEEAIEAVSPVHAEARGLEAAPTQMAAAAAPKPVPATGGMTLMPSQKLICERIINVFETGSARGDYGNISIYPDGPNRIRQITYGRSQTTEYSHLRELVQMYVDASGKYSEDLRPYVPLIGRTALVNNDVFKGLLRRAGREDPIMAQTQDVFFDRAYFQPAFKWANEHGFTQALSMLVIYDSFIHSGGILDFLRARFREQPPADAGDEKVWISEYVQARNNWLATNSRQILRPTVYRTQCFAHEIARGNWDLSELPIIAHGVGVDDKSAAVSRSLSLAVTARAREPGMDGVPYLGPDGGENVFGEESFEVWGDDQAANDRSLPREAGI